MNKKVLIISPYFFEPHRWMISAYKTALFLSKNTKVVVLTTGKPYKETVNDNLTVYRMKDIFLPDPINFSIVPMMFFHLIRVIRREKPDYFIVNKNMFYTSLCIIWLRLLRKKVVTQVDTFPGINWFSRNKIVNIVLWLYSRTIGLLLLRLSQKTILLHEGLIPVAEKYNLNYAVIHNGVDLELIKKAKKADDLAKKPGEVRVVYVGRLESVKGYIDYLEAGKTLSSKNQNLTFFVVGNTVGKEEIISKYGGNQIKFLGHRKDIFSILKTADIFVFTVLFRGVAKCLMEAMAVGLACVASDVGGVKILIKNSENGLLFSPGNRKELVKQLQILIDNPTLRGKLGQNAKANILKNFNWNKIATELTELLEEA